MDYRINEDTQQLGILFYRLFGVLQGLAKVILDLFVRGPEVSDSAELLIVEHSMADKKEAIHAYLLPKLLYMSLFLLDLYKMLLAELIIHLYAPEVSVIQDQLCLIIQLGLRLVVIKLFGCAVESQSALGRAWLVLQAKCVSDWQLVG